MKLFLLKAFVLACLMFLCVLTGMQLANDGMNRMRGYEDPSLKSAFTVKETGNGQIETAILGKQVSSHDLEQKKQQLEKMKAYNLFSSAGKKLADGLGNAVEKSLDMISGKED
jgi:hypothetical protein